MTWVVVSDETAGAIDQIAAGLDALNDAGVDPFDAKDARALVGEVEALGRRIDSVRVALVGAIDQRGLHRGDGHASAKVMVRHVARLSSSEAARRSQTVEALRDLPLVESAFSAGEIGTCQVRRIARAHANRRVRDQLIAGEQRFVAQARRLSYRDFDGYVSAWVDRADADGTRDTAQRSHENRDAKIVQDFDKSWRQIAACGPLQGAVLHDIHTNFTNAEFEADWAKARIEKGDAATVEDLPRSEGQRRFDALFHIFDRAASAGPDGIGSKVVTNVVVDHATFERELARLAGADPASVDPNDESYRCSTIDGAPLEPTEVVAACLLAHVRRVVVGADGVVIDLGRERRLFTGSAQLAAKITSTECYWPGCHVPGSQCQVDHLIPWADHGGETNPGNGGPACGRHNRLKQLGFTAWRDPTGDWHVLRPDGTEIE